MQIFPLEGEARGPGGHCLVAWDKVASPKEVGGLGIPNLHLLNLALRCRWAWLQKQDTSRPWSEFDLQIPRQARVIFEAAACFTLGNGERACFWSDRWLFGARVDEIAPNLVKVVPPRWRKARTVKDGLSGAWLLDCGPDLGDASVEEFFTLWHVLATVQLSPGVDDVLTWRWTKDGAYSAKSAYNAFFAGSTRAPVAEQIWRSRAPYSGKFFAWLASRDRCWTGDRLERRGLPRPAACPLCDQQQESIRHLLVGCVVAREVWAWTLRHWAKPMWVPTHDTELLRGGLRCWLRQKASVTSGQPSFWSSGVSGGTGMTWSLTPLPLPW
uniref:Uncharacterized protein n=2 Tax=Avena sativa TaxID=4498 RepID=A0ACD6A3J2_AVESA